MQVQESVKNTTGQYDEVVSACRQVFAKKMLDYGPSWRILRPMSISDQLFIKANRIRNIEEKGEAKVDEGVSPEYMALVNYSIIGLIQLEKGVLFLLLVF